MQSFMDLTVKVPSVVSFHLIVSPFKSKDGCGQPAVVALHRSFSLCINGLRGCKSQH